MTGTPVTLWRARAAVSALFTVYGFLMTLWVVHIPEITSATSVSKPVLGLLVMLRVAASVLIMQLSGPLADRAGTRRLAAAATVTLSVSIIGPAIARNPAELAIALVIFGFAVGGIEVAGNTQGVQIERGFGRPIMSSVQAFFGCGAIAGALTGAGAQALHAPPALTLGLAGAVGLIISATAIVPWLLPHTATVRQQPRTPWSQRVIALGVLAFTVFFAAGTAYDWAALQLKDRLAVSDAIAALGFTAYSVALTVSRFRIDPISRRWGQLRVVRAGALLGAAGLAVVMASGWVAVTVLGWLLFGLGVAGILPQVASAAGGLAGGKATNIARVISIGFCGMLAGPVIIGGLTRAVSLTAALTAPLLALLFCCWFAGRAIQPAR